MLVVRFRGGATKSITVTTLDDTQALCYLLGGSEGLLTGDPDGRAILWRELPLQNWKGFVQYGCSALSDVYVSGIADWQELEVIGYVADIATWQLSHVTLPETTSLRTETARSRRSRSDVRERK